MSGIEVGTLALIAGGLGAVDSLVGGLQQASNAKYNAKVAKANAAQAEAEAAEEARRKRDLTMRLIGTKRAAAGAMGLDLDGSFLESLTDSAAQGELDALTTVWQGRRIADQYRAQAKAFKAQGRGAIVGGVLGAGTRALGGLASFYATPAAAVRDVGPTGMSFADELAHGYRPI